jgi:protein O-mannosyl-transferase
MKRSKSRLKSKDAAGSTAGFNTTHILAGLALGAITMALYLPMLSAEFVYDARLQILSDPYLHDRGNLLDILSLKVLSRDVLDFNRPLNLLSLMIDSALWGRNPGGYHFTNILLHALTTAVVFLLCVRLLRRENAPAKWKNYASACAFFAALFFAVHPINCETVAEVSYREDLLSAFFVALGLLLATWFWPEWSWRAFATGAGCVMCMFLAVAGKENGIAGPSLLIAYWLCFRRQEPRRGWLVLMTAAVLVVAAFLVARFLLEPRPSLIFTERPRYPGGSFIQMLALQPSIWAFYLRQLVLPQGFCADYGNHSIRNFGLVLSIVALLLVLTLQIIVWKRSRLFGFGVLVFWLSLIPVSNFIPIYRPMADRFLYLPMVGIAVMIASGFFQERLARSVVARAFLSVIAISVAIVFAVTTLRRERVWQDSLSLWTDTLKKNPDSYNGALGMGHALERLDRFGEAVSFFRRAIQISKGRKAGAYAGMATSLDALGRHDEADAAYQTAVELDPRYEDPEAVVKALIWERDWASKLERLARRN